MGARPCIDSGWDPRAQAMSRVAAGGPVAAWTGMKPAAVTSTTTAASRDARTRLMGAPPRRVGYGIDRKLLGSGCTPPVPVAKPRHPALVEPYDYRREPDADRRAGH